MINNIVLGVLLVSASSAKALTLDEYISNVKKSSLGIKSSELQAEGQGQLVSEADLVTSPKLFIQGQNSFNSKLGNPPLSLYDKLNSTNLSAGISQQFGFGLQMNFSYTLANTYYTGATFNPRNFWDLSPSIDLVMPLWANGFGRSVNAQQELVKQQNISNKLLSLAAIKSKIIEAENVYWQLAAAQERVMIQEQSLTAAKNIFNYVSKQNSKNLGETADVLQANALVEAYNLQLLQANNEKLQLERSFNKFLNTDSNLPVPKLDSINYSLLEKYKAPEKKPGKRLDVLAGDAQVKMAKASGQLIKERNKPNLDLVGGYTMQGRGVEVGKALENSIKTRHDSGYVGVNFSIPLNFSATSETTRGAERLIESAELNAKNLQYTEDQDWVDLQQKINESKLTLKNMKLMEAAQKEKLNNERVRLRQGRTTTYQVLLFEQDYSSSEVSRIRAATELISLISQIKLYEEEK